MAYLVFFYGLALAIEVFAIRALNNGGPVRTGWGINNNVAGQLCICLAGPMYLAIKKKWAPVYLISEGVILLAVGVTNSRTGSLMGTIICVASLIIFYIKTDNKKRLQSGIIGSLAITSFLAFTFIFKDIFIEGFAGLFNRSHGALSLNGRQTIWDHAYQSFLSNPSFVNSTL